MTDNTFDHNLYLNDLYEQLESCTGLTAEFDGTYLHIYIEGKEYLIHWHDVKQQVWLASPVSGAHHFEYSDKKTLCSTRDPDIILKQLLEEELGIVL
jgi:frataxin